MKYHFKVHKENGGFWAECLELKGCFTQGDSMTELEKNMKEAVELFVSEPADSKVILSLPKKSLKGPNVVAVGVDPKIAFAFHLRRLRLKRKLTQQEAAKRMGFKNLYSYQRIENAKIANPELTTIIQIKKVFPEFNLDDIIAA